MAWKVDQKFKWFRKYRMIISLQASKNPIVWLKVRIII